MAQKHNANKWEMLVEPVGDGSQDGLISLAAELADQLYETDIPYTLESDRSITLHISKAVKRV